MVCLRFATIKINELKSPTRKRMRLEYIKFHEIDILLVQEVTNVIKQDFFSYEIHYSIGASKSGTALVAREGIRL